MVTKAKRNAGVHTTRHSGFSSGFHSPAKGKSHACLPAGRKPRTALSLKRYTALKIKDI